MTRRSFRALGPPRRSAHRGRFVRTRPRARCIPLRALLAAALGLVVLAGCQPDEPPAAGEDALVVFAAASLRDAFAELGDAFERSHPGLEVSFNFAGTQQLRTQIEHGAAVDVFASADRHHLHELARAFLVADPVVFARNEPVIVVSRESTGSLDSFEDLPNAARIVVGTPEVPIGRYTQQILDRARSTLGIDFRARVEARVASRELNARQVLTKVILGEAQAGIVYRTDALASPNPLTVLPIPAEYNVVAEYPIAVVTEAPHPERARAWVSFVLSPEGQRVLAQAGFAPGDRGSH